jgi:adenylate cyclase
MAVSLRRQEVMSQSPKILLVDDELDTLRLVCRILQADGYHVIEAKDGKEAITLYEEEHPDVILLDIIIPHIDGVRVLRMIRERDQQIGIIMVSALNSERLTIDCMQAGADDYVVKPFQLREIRSRIKQVLEKSLLRRHNAELQKQLDEVNAKMHLIVQHYLPEQVAASLIDHPGPPSLGGSRQEVTILFADLHYFTHLAETLPPDELINTLNRYLSAVADAVVAHQGTLDKFMGDGAMVLFNAPIPQPDHVARAVQTALDIRSAVQNLANSASLPPLSLSIGIHTGEAVVGNIGSKHLMNYTAVGDAVVVAKRLQEIAEGSSILVSQQVYDQVHAIVAARDIGIVSVKNRSEPVRVYEVLHECTSRDDSPNMREAPSQ